MILSIIAAIGRNNEIGKSNGLLWKLPKDLEYFKETTSGHPVIMGHKTFLSIGKKLPNRRNIVISREEIEGLEEGVEQVRSVESLFELLSNTTTDSEECFIIGGGQIYKLFIEVVDKLYITHVDEVFPEADTFFPEINEDIWKESSSRLYLKDEKNPYDLYFKIYNNIKKPTES
jgi:dihydrofolate reductase